MNIIRHHESCVGIQMFKWNQHTAELWYCPAGYNIQKHSHPNEDIELMYICGQTTFYRQWHAESIEESFAPRWYHVFRSFTVPPNWPHRFSVGKWPLVFINFAKWKVGTKPTSASVDFELTK